MIFSPLEQFEIFPLVTLHFGFFDFSVTNATLQLFQTLFVVVFVFQCIESVGNGFQIPNSWQFIFENFYLQVCAIVTENIGKNEVKYFPFVFSQFLFLIVANQLGIMPYSYTVISHLIITFSLALSLWVGKLIQGFYKHGLKQFAQFQPQGAPFAIVPFQIIIEILSFFITVISLSVRLFANIIAGHILIKVLAGFAWVIMSYGGFQFFAHFQPLLVLVCLIGLELGVGIVQAYVFSLLTCLYLADMVSGGH